jgi:quinol monooxygenase YgiN
MASGRYILLVEASVKPEHLEEAIQAAQTALGPTLREAGCDAFFQTARIDQPNELVFFEVFASDDAHDHHLEQDYTKRVFAALEGKLQGPPRMTRLRDLADGVMQE